MAIHKLKAWPWEFGRILSGGRAAVRLNDRDYKVGDKLVVKEFDARKKEFSGRQLELTLSFIQPIDVQKYWPDGFVDETYLYGLSRPLDPILFDPTQIITLKAQSNTFHALESGSRIDFRDERLKLGATVKYVLVEDDGEPVPGERPQYRYIKQRDLVPVLQYHSLKTLHKSGLALLAWRAIYNVSI